jgi:hypothetical protein
LTQSRALRTFEAPAIVNASFAAVSNFSPAHVDSLSPIDELGLLDACVQGDGFHPPGRPRTDLLRVRYGRTRGDDEAPSALFDHRVAKIATVLFPASLA